MCDYSLEHLASRPAQVGDKLVTTHFKHSVTGGFCAVGEPNIAVCLRPGTEMAFEREIEGQSGLWMRPKKLGSKVARFRRVNQDIQAAHHDALELPNGQIVFLTRLCEGQFATVIQLPTAERQREEPEGTTEVAATPGNSHHYKPRPLGGSALASRPSQARARQFSYADGRQSPKCLG